MADPWAVVSREPVGPSQAKPDDGWVVVKREKVKPRTNRERFEQNIEDAYSRSPLVAGMRGRELTLRGLENDAAGMGAANEWAAAVGPPQPVDPNRPGAQLEAAAAERARREAFEATGASDPWYEAPTLREKLMRGASTLGGQIVGALGDPLSYVNPGSNVATRAASQAAVAAGGDVLTQGADINTGVQDTYSPGQTAAAGAIGAGISVGGDAIAAGGRAAGRALDKADPWGVVKRETVRAAEGVARAVDDGWKVAERERAPSPSRATPGAPAGRVASEAQMRQIVGEILPGATITSGRRTAAKNKAVGGAERSYHLSGQALDMVPPQGVTLAQFRASLEARGIPIRELLDEGDHWHLAWGEQSGRAAAPRVTDEPAPLPPELANLPDVPLDQIPDAGAPPAMRGPDAGPEFRDQYARAREGGEPPTVAERLDRLTQQEAAAPVRPAGELPPMDAAPRVLESEGLRARLDELQGDMNRLADEVRSEVAAALDEGRPVTLYAEGRPVEITSVRDGALRDAQGQPWGVQPLLQPRPGVPDRLEISPRRPRVPEMDSRRMDAGAEIRAAERLGMAPGPEARRAAIDAPGGQRRGAIDLSAYERPNAQASKNVGGLREAARPGDVQAQAGGTPFRGQTISQLARRLRQSLGITHRQGRLTLKGGAVGEYDPKSAVIRTKAVQELDVLAHEATHALEFKGGPAVKAALQAHDAELRKLAYPGANPAHMREEGFAEFGRWYLTNPAHARKLAPNFYDAFERAFAADNPQAAAEFKAIQDAYQQFLSAPSLETAAASVAFTGNPGPIGRARQALADRGLGGVLKDLADDAYTAFIDDLHPVAKAVRRLQEIYAENTGKPLELSVAKNPYSLARLSRESYAAGHVDLMEGVVPYRGVDPSGASLSQALELALGAKTFGKWSKDDLAKFDAYLIARRMVHEWDRYAAGELPNPPDRNSKDYHLAVIRDAEAANPTWSDASALVYEWLNNLWRKEFDAGLITRESYEHGLSAHPDYVPLMRDVSDKGPMGTRRPRGAMQFAGGVKAFEGSSRDVISPLSSMMRRAYELNAIIKRNDALKALDDLAEAAGPGSGAIVERLPAQEIEAINVDAIDALTKAAEAAGLSERDVTTLVQAADAALDGQTQATVFRGREVSPKKGEAVVFVWRKGKKTPLLLPDGRFGQEMYAALTGMNRDLQSGVVDAMAAGSQLLRYGVTLSPEFMARNFVRDQLATWINTDVGFRPVIGSIRGAVEEIGQTPAATRYAIAGGMRGGPNVAATRKPFPRDDLEAQAQLQHLRDKGYRIRRYASWRGLAELTDLSETSTRLGVFKAAFNKAKRRGLSDYDAVLEAAFTSRDYLDFGRRGAKMLSAVRLVTFLNASLQSLDKTVRVLTAGGNLHKVLAPFGKGAPKTDAERRALQHAYKAWAKVSALGMLGLGLRMLYADDPEYQEVSDTLRATHWVAKVEGRWVFIPKPFELATLSNILERAYEAGALKDPTAPQRLLSDFSHTIAPPHEIPAVSVPFAIASNRDYQGRPIVPDHLRGTVDPHLQFNSYTSEFSKKLGEVLGVSPAVIDYVITGFGGSLGRYFQQGTNMAVEAVTGEPVMASGPEDMFLSRGFVRNITRGSASQKEFWNLVSRTGGELTRAEGTFRAYMKAREDDKAAGYLNSLEPSARAYVKAKVFTQDGSAKLHPLVRTQETLSAIGDLRQANRGDELRTLTGEAISLTPQGRREVDDALAHLAMVQMRNALIETGERGWAQKEPLSEVAAWKRLERASRPTAFLLWQTLAVQKVPMGEQAREAWRQVRPAAEAKVSPEDLSPYLSAKRLRSGDRLDRLRESQAIQREAAPPSRAGSNALAPSMPLSPRNALAGSAAGPSPANALAM